MDSRPNIVLLMTDQQRADTLGVLGSPVARTPNFDALAARGTVFSNAFSQHSVCSQSRISIMTGWYPHTAGHRTLDNLLKPWEPNLLRTFKDAGYHVAWAGARGDTMAPGVTEESTDFAGFRTYPDRAAFAHGLAMPGPDTPDLERIYTPRAVEIEGPTVDEANVATAIDLLREGMPEPWLLFVALIGPHPPFQVREPWLSLHDRSSMPDPLPVPAVGKPAFMDELRRRYGWERVSPESWKEMAAVYHGMVSHIDHLLGTLLEAVEAASRSHLVATFTDHGEYLGDFGLMEKWPSGVDECLLRNPLIISAPGGAGGQRSDAMVEMIDLLPTLAEYAGVEVGHAHFGRSLGPLLRGETPAHREAAFSDGGFRVEEASMLEGVLPGSWYEAKGSLQAERPELVGTASVMRTPEWTYVRRRYEGDELYHRRSDPREERNVIDRAENATAVSELSSRMLDWLQDTGAVIPPDRDPRFPRLSPKRD